MLRDLLEQAEAGAIEGIAVVLTRPGDGDTASAMRLAVQSGDGQTGERWQRLDARMLAQAQALALRSGVLYGQSDASEPDVLPREPAEPQKPGDLAQTDE